MSDDERSARRKDRLIQTRVPSVLESTLKEEARKQRLSVSHLIRNILEDTFHLVDNVVVEVDNIVNDSVGLATQLKRDAQKLASSARGLRAVPEAEQDASAGPPGPAAASPAAPESAAVPSPAAAASTPEQAPKPGPAADALAHVFAWNPVVLNRAETCSKCSAALPKGQEAFVGLSDDATKPRAWLCADCADQL